MIPPVIANEHGDVSFFRSLEDAERYLEPIDVAQGEYVMYDGSGRRLAPGVVRRKKGRLGGLLGVTREEVCITETGVDAEAELRETLLGFLHRTSQMRESLELQPLDDLVRRAVAIAGFTR
jgi:hypothetical protein